MGDIKHTTISIRLQLSTNKIESLIQQPRQNENQKPKILTKKLRNLSLNLPKETNNRTPIKQKPKTLRQIR